MGGLRLYIRYLQVSVQSQMQYRASVLMQVFARLVLSGTEILAVWALFDRFGSLPGWSFAQVALLYGMVNITFAISDGLATGFDLFPNLLRTGDFDRLLLRPRSTVLQLAGQELAVRRVGRLIQGTAVLIIAAAALDIHWTPAKGALLLAAISGGACLFFALVVVQATVSFWTIESLELMNVLTYGGVETAQYPMSIYRGWFRRFFTFGVPLACVCYYPVMAILDRPGTPLEMALRWVSPLAGVVCLLLALRLWRFGVRHYGSTGS